MARPDPSWVLDTSVAVAWFFSDDVQHDDARRVLDAVADRPDDFAVPELFYSELIHVLARKSGQDQGFVEDALASVLDLGLRTLPLTGVALGDAARLACAGLAGYDATFVALASERGALWLTADDRAARAAGVSATTIDRFVLS